MSLDIDSALQLRRNQSLTSIIRRELEQMIERGELSAGERLNENALAAKLGVSRGPIREACRGLEQSGLVNVVVNRGVFIRALDGREAAELYEIRAALYGLAGRLLAPIVTDEQVAILTGYVEEMDAAMAAGDLNSFYPGNLRFHEAIVEFGGNARLAAECAAIHREMHLLRRRTLDMPGRMMTSNDEHRAILERIAARDPAGAEAALEEHVLISRNALFGPLGHYPDT
ncbi:DNA-binding GntR family transcriptional regulator [Bosea sp. BE125]|uniref:FCD domain-containing protein n=1 Tax=Bosea sp. BE125 TaxID=2817909 RepID=UPI00286506CF|nr:FCD domain-containing protein [Bosea sp. BE125]MDR6869391.1 DNA-binding GntR family transcriptional regulator [Bosea sp. BE125]